MAEIMRKIQVQMEPIILKAVLKMSKKLTAKKKNNGKK
jgi:hypothetical protein